MSQTERLDPASLVRQASAIGDTLLEEAEPLADGSLTWHRGYDLALGGTEDAGIFNGRAGEALFFAALYAASGEARFERAALRAAQGVLSVAEAGRAGELGERIGIGLVGLGSLAYGLVHTSRFLQRPDLVRAAARLGEGITPELIAMDEKLDLFWGAAGGLLGSLALHRAGIEGALQRANACADHLLAGRSTHAPSGCRAWLTVQPGEHLSGFAHGASGIAHALLELHSVTGAPALYEAAVEAFAFERTLYRPGLANWVDSTGQPDDQPVLSSWCHGAPGIALARLSALDATGAAVRQDILQDLDLALSRTATQPANRLDSLCCGNFGRILILLEAGRRLGNESLVRQGRKVANACLHLVEHRGYAVGNDSEEAHFKPGLWQGLAGVGYALLHMAQPERFPVILTLS